MQDEHLQRDSPLFDVIYERPHTRIKSIQVSRLDVSETETRLRGKKRKKTTSSMLLNKSLAENFKWEKKGNLLIISLFIFVHFSIMIHELIFVVFTFRLSDDRKKVQSKLDINWVSIQCYFRPSTPHSPMTTLACAKVNRNPTGA